MMGKDEAPSFQSLCLKFFLSTFSSRFFCVGKVSITSFVVYLLLILVNNKKFK